jgi:hypothetical protein
MKVLLWLFVSIAAVCGTYFHFAYGSVVWALTDIPFVLLLILAFVDALRSARPPTKGSSLRDQKNESRS